MKGREGGRERERERENLSALIRKRVPQHHKHGIAVDAWRGLQNVKAAAAAARPAATEEEKTISKKKSTLREPFNI